MVDSVELPKLTPVKEMYSELFIYVTADTVYVMRQQFGVWSSLLTAQVCRLGLKVCSRLALFCVHRVNRANSRNDSES